MGEVTMNIVKINQSHRGKISDLLRTKIIKAKEACPILPMTYVLDKMDDYVEKILSCDGYIIEDKDAFISFTYAGQLFYGKDGLYTAEWAHVLPEDPEVVCLLLEKSYDYMLANNLKDHTISYLEHRKDLHEFFFNMSYGSRCLDGHSPVLNKATNDSIQLASHKYFDQLVSLLDCHHDYLNSTSAYLGMSFTDSKNLITKWLEESKLYIKVVNDQVQGMIYLNEGSSGGCAWSSDPQTLGIQTTQVLPEHQGQGIGRELIDFAHQHAKAKGFKRLAVDYESFNFKAHKLWSKNFTLTFRSVIRSLG